MHRLGARSLEPPEHPRPHPGAPHRSPRREAPRPVWRVSLDPMLAGFSQASAQLLDPDYRVAATANLWFMIASTVLLTAVGWGVTARWVEPRFQGKAPEEGGATPISTEELRAQGLDETEKRGLRVAGVAVAEQTDTLLFLATNNLQIDTLAVRMRDLFADSLNISRLGSTNAIPRDTLKFQLNNPLISLNAARIKVTNKDSMQIPVATWIDRRSNIASILFNKTDEQLYTIEILPNAFTDFFENTNDTLNYGMRTLEVSDYGELSMTLANVKKYPIIVELVDSKYKVAASRYLTENTPLYFSEGRDQAPLLGPAYVIEIGSHVVPPSVLS